jgi:hypothetical protein
MLDLRQIRNAATNVAIAVACVAAAGGAVAQEGASAASRIYQQRTPDGRIVLTDRPVTGAVTQRTWQPAPEDAAAARQRRDEARLEALAVNERIERRVESERQRDHEFALAHMQLAQAQAKLDAERARAEAAAQAAAAFVPSFTLRPFPRPPRLPRPGPPRPRLPMQPVFGMFGAPTG